MARKPARLASRTVASARRCVRYLLIALAAAAVGALGFAYAQSGGGYSMNLNSPVSFPVDI